MYTTGYTPTPAAAAQTTTTQSTSTSLVQASSSSHRFTPTTSAAATRGSQVRSAKKLIRRNGLRSPLRRVPSLTKRHSFNKEEGRKDNTTVSSRTILKHALIVVSVDTAGHSVDECRKKKRPEEQQLNLQTQ